MAFRSILLNGLTPIFLIAMATFAKAEGAIDVALITSLQGNVGLVTQQGQKPLQAFVKLKRGDMVTISDAKLQIVYFQNGRQESWQGVGRIEVLATEGRGVGLSNPGVKTLPEIMVKQIARTPAVDSQGRAGAMRLRAIATPEAIAKLDDEYRKMRMEAVRGDLNPELYLLSGLFEMREFDRIEQVLQDLQLARPGDMEVGLVITLYQKAIKNARESRAQ